MPGLVGKTPGHSLAWQALDEECEYKIFFRQGITYRDDSILRFINYASKGSASIASIGKHYQKILTGQEVLEALEKLTAIGCLVRDNEQVTITEIGKGIV